MVAVRNIPPISTAKRLISLEAYHRLYSQKEDGFKYEWNNGIIEKTPRTMNRSQLYIARILTRLFSQTKAYRHMGELAWEVTMFLPTANRNRVADLAYLTNEQVEEQEDLKPTISPFVIEIISKNDTADEVEEKLGQYFANGIRVIWQIYPNQNMVKVYTSKDNVTICRGDAICTASPVLPDFQIKAQDIFTKKIV